MIEKQTTLELSQIVASGALQLKFGLIITDDGLEIARKEGHRIALAPGADIDISLAGTSDGIVAMGWPAINQDIIDIVKNYAGISWTPEVIAAYETQQAELLADEADNTESA